MKDLRLVKVVRIYFQPNANSIAAVPPMSVEGQDRRFNDVRSTSRSATQWRLRLIASRSPSTVPDQLQHHPGHLMSTLRRVI